MMRHLSAILLSFVFLLAWGILSHEDLSGFRNVTENPSKAVAGYIETDCSFTASTDCVVLIPQRSVYEDESAYYQLADAVLFGSSCRQGNTYNQLFRLKAFCMGQMQGVFDACRSKRYSATSFTPSAIRYLRGYYIYELARILI